ncbi:MAG: DEAD/DEAH box helicase [Acidimicrobiia bacterium]|nr:DEAD/DEAH box helicase [Acidimicrobiia bacterium]
MTTGFARLGLPEPIVNSLTKRDITEPFPVQAAAIPDAMAGRDVSGKAPTGSGKTLAFGLPLLARVDKSRRNKPKALILAPTRELAEQIKKELTAPAKAAGRYVFAVYGGVSYGPQKQAFRKGVDVLVATPGRLEDLIEQRTVDLSEAHIVVVDEADRMADMGFLPAVRRILDQTARQRQTLLFSATLDGDIATLSRTYQNNPVRHDAGAVEAETIDARHHFWLVEHHDRVQHTADVVGAAGRSIVFTRTRHGADRLARQLGKLGVGTVALHGGRSQNQRTRALRTFATGKAQALIATDVAARGIHIDAVESVVHFDPPADHKDYLHRSGRTARAGASGLVVSLVTGNQKRTVGRMQKDLALQAPIERPRPDLLHEGGYRIGERVAAGRRTERNQAPPRDHTRRKQGKKHPNGREGGVGHSVYVANLPYSTSANQLQDLFGVYGKVHQATVITDKRTGRSKGFGFVDMPQRAARRAIENLHGSTYAGRDLTVRLAQPRTYGA